MKTLFGARSVYDLLLRAPADRGGGGAAADDTEDFDDGDEDEGEAEGQDGEEADREEAAEPDDEQDEEGDEGQDGVKAGAQDPPRRSRYESRVQKIRNEFKTYQTDSEKRIQALQRELQEIRNGRTQVDDARAEEERLAMMTVEERVEYKLQKALSEDRRQRAIEQFNSADRADKTAFEAKALSNPRYKKYGEEVEAELQRLRGQGLNATREQLLAYVIGRKVLAGGEGERPRKQREAANERVRRNTTSPSAGRDDRASGRRGERSLEERLENQLI